MKRSTGLGQFVDALEYCAKRQRIFDVVAECGAVYVTAEM